MRKYQLHTRYPLEQGILMALEEISSSMDLYNLPIEEPERTVHQSRKSIKRIRAILKLIRDETGYSFYFRENRFFRDLSRKMSPARDFTVLLETLNHVEKKYSGKLDESEFRLLRKHLHAGMEAQFRALYGARGGFSEIAGEIGAALQRISSTISLRNDFVSIGSGMRRIYRRARNHLHHMDREPCMETLHEYRKNCRYLQYQVELIRPIYPELLKAYSSSMDRHTETLGKIRDYHRFETYLVNETPDLLTGPDRDTFLESVRQMRSKATEGVFKHAELLFAEKPLAFIKRIRFYWNIHYNIN